MELFPRGLEPFLVGGVVLGAAVATVYLLTGRIAGISSFLTSVQSFWSRRPFFRQSWVRRERVWKATLVAGLLLGAAAVAWAQGEIYVSSVGPVRLAISGLFVGYGTRLARGCTSGHGICGVSAGSLPSIASTISFVLVAVATAWLVARTGVTP